MKTLIDTVERLADEKYSLYMGGGDDRVDCELTAWIYNVPQVAVEDLVQIKFEKKRAAK